VKIISYICIKKNKIIIIDQGRGGKQEGNLI